MLTLGIHGGVNTYKSHKYRAPGHWAHDASAALCKDGQLVAAAEEERFTRVKHTNYFPLAAIQHCFESQSITLDQIDQIVLGSGHMDIFYDRFNRWNLGTKAWMSPNYKTLVVQLLQEEHGIDVTDKISYGGHHLNHAYSAVHFSGYDDCLCVVLDGWGDGLTGIVLSYKDNHIEVLDRIKPFGPANLYLLGTQLIGYDQFDEYKVMGLAPYGDPSRFQARIEKVIELLPEGKFKFHEEFLTQELFPEAVRQPGSDFLQVHKDFAAGLQKAVEKVMFHVMTHYREVSGHTHLAIAGGFFQNCTANGELMRSNLFDDLFIQPVAYDAGLAIGAAVHGFVEAGGTMPKERMTHLYLGYETPENDKVAEILEKWRGLVSFEKKADISQVAAEKIAEGHVIAWVQGKAEFGARALGNRSILADPRPAYNKERINAMVKKREGYRPFAPSVMEEYLHEFFDVPEKYDLPFMVFVVDVREQHRQKLGAITHVDGSARVQSVSRSTNEKYWHLIDHFRQLTDVPMVLNTSFNNNVEPIVDSPEDALNSFLSTDIDYLVIGDYIISKKEAATQPGSINHLMPRLSHRFFGTRSQLQDGGFGFFIQDKLKESAIRVSETCFNMLFTAAEDEVSFGTLLQNKDPKLEQELYELWEKRVFIGDMPG